MKNNLKIDRKKAIIFAVVFVIACLIFWFGYEDIQMKIHSKTLFSLGENSIVTQQLDEGSEITQEFRVKSDTFSGLSLRFATFTTEIESGLIQYQLIDTQSNEVVREAEFDAREIKDNDYYKIMFDRPIFDMKGHEYTLKIFIKESSPNNKLVVYLTNPNEYDEKLTTTTVNGEILNRDIVLNQLQDDGIFLNKVYVGIAAVLMMLLIADFVLIGCFKPKLHNMYLLNGIVLGLVMMMMIPVYVVPDEPAHIYTAYALSNNIMGISNGEDGTVTMRYDDANTELKMKGIDAPYYNWYYQHSLKGMNNSELVATKFTSLKAHNYQYIFSALGITLGRVLNLGTVMTYMLGRLFNMLFFVAVVYWCIKKIPVAKSLIMMLALLPMSIQQASSFSYDAIIIPLALCVFVYTIRIAYEKNEVIKWYDYVIMIVAAAFLLPTKGGAYIPVSMFPVFLIFKHREWFKERISHFKTKNKKVFYSVCGAGAAIVVAGIVAAIYMISNMRFINMAESHTVGWSGTEGYTIGYFIKYPLEILLVSGRTFHEQADYYFSSFFGNSLGWFELNIPRVIIYPFVVMLVIASLRKENEEQLLSKKSKICFNIIGITSFMLVCGGMLLAWSPISVGRIAGVQGRYFIPFAAIMLMTLRSKKFSVSADVDKKICLCTVCMYVCVYVSLFVRA